MKNRDLFMIGAGVAAIGAAWYIARQGFTSISDVAASLKRNLTSAAGNVAAGLNPASQDNYVNQVVNDAISAAAGRDTSLGSLAADIVPSAAERQVNAPGFWINAPKAGPLSNLTPMLEGEFGAQPYDVTGFVGNYPADPNEPAIFYRSMKRTVH